MLRILIAGVVVIAVSGCGGHAELPFSPAPALGGLPSPTELARRAPGETRTVSGSHSSINRTFVGLGNSFVTVPGWSSNAEAADANAKISGATDG